jgi:hypothetical protein
LIDEDQIRNRRKQRQEPSDAEKQKDWDRRKEILRVEAIITGAERTIAEARIDLERLYDQKKQWDNKFGPINDTTHSSRNVPVGPTPRLSVAVSVGPSLPRPTPLIVDDDDDDLDEAEVHDDQVETEEQEKGRLVKLFIKPGLRTSPAANHIGLLRLMADIHDAYPQQFNLQFPLAPSYANIIPILKHELTDSRIWDELNTELAKLERSVGYVACSKMYVGEPRVHKYTEEQRVIVWSWWWDQLWHASVFGWEREMWTQIWEILKAKITTLPRNRVGRKAR